jgi:hypothetical protein
MVGESKEVTCRASKGRSNQIPLTKASLVNKEVCSLGQVIEVCNPNCPGTLQITTHLIHCSCLVFAAKTNNISCAFSRHIMKCFYTFFLQ